MTDERMMRCAHIHISKRRNRRFLCYPYCARAPPPPAAVTKGSYNNEKLTFRFGFAPEPFFTSRGRFFILFFVCARNSGGGNYSPGAWSNVNAKENTRCPYEHTPFADLAPLTPRRLCCGKKKVFIFHIFRGQRNNNTRASSHWLIRLVFWYQVRESFFDSRRRDWLYIVKRYKTFDDMRPRVINPTAFSLGNSTRLLPLATSDSLWLTDCVFH